MALHIKIITMWQCGPLAAATERNMPLRLLCVGPTILTDYYVLKSEKRLEGKDPVVALNGQEGKDSNPVATV